MKKKTHAQVFLGAWVVFLLLGRLIGLERLIAPIGMIIASGVLAVLLTLLVRRWFGTADKVKASMRFCTPGSSDVVWRVETMWIYKGMEPKASLYMRGYYIHSLDQKQPLYRYKGDLVYRAGEEQPFLRREGDKILSCADNSVVYEIK